MAYYTQYAYWPQFSFGGDGTAFLWEESSSTFLLFENGDGTFVRIHGTDFQFDNHGVSSGAIHSMHHYTTRSDDSILASIDDPYDPLPIVVFNFEGTQDLTKATFDPEGNFKLVAWMLRGSDSVSSRIASIPDGEPNFLAGWGGNDVIKGSRFFDHIAGGGGSDLIKGARGDDFISGDAEPHLNSIHGFGNDTVYGGAGMDTLDGADGDDRLLGGNGGDILVGGKGHDRLFGGNGNDALYGGDNSGGVDHGRDVLNGGAGADTMRGEYGNDTYFVDDLGDVVDERWSDGRDRVISSIDFYVLPSGVENLTLVDGASSATGNELANLLKGRDDGDDQLYGLAGRDRLFGHGGNDGLYGSDGADRLDGGDGDDVVNGGRGRDVLLGGIGDDALHGGPGIDTFVFRPGDGRDEISGYRDGIDLIDVRAYGYASPAEVLALAQQNGSDVTVTNGADQIRLVDFALADLDSGDFLV